jgi:hypothetical protein
VAAAANGQQDAVLARVIDRGNDIRHVGAPHDQRGLLVDHGVIKFACFVVAGVGRLEYFAAQAGAECCVIRHLSPSEKMLLSGIPIPRSKTDSWYLK